MTIMLNLLLGALIGFIPISAYPAEQKISIYGWLPTLSGELTFKVPGEPDDEANANAIDSLDAIFMGTYELRQNKWSFIADLIYLKISGDTQGINPNG